METSDPPQSSRLLLRLALAVADSKYPLTVGRRVQSAQGEAVHEQEQGHAAPLSEHLLGRTDHPLPEAAWQRLEDLKVRFQAELSFADSFLADEPPSSRVQMLLVNSSELRKVAVLQRFIDRAYSFRLDQPREGLQLADELITWTKNDPSPLVAVVRCRAWMERGNFLRILGDAAGAYEALAKASRELEANGSDPLELARYQELLGTLKRDCGDFEAATALLKKALAKVRRWGDSHSLQRVLIATSIAELCNNNFQEADALLDESLKTAEPDCLLLRIAAVNRLLVYLFSGKPHKAYQVLLRVRSNLGSSWLRELPEPNRVAALWAEGQILNTLGIDDEALPLLRKAREFFIRSARGYEVCHISIELASTYAAQQRFGEVRRELAFGLPFCSPARSLDNHAREVVSLLQAALEHQGRLEADQLRTVAHRLDCIRRAPLQDHRQASFADLYR
jgi:tetratricopeptide (TPR) repeat protein